MRAAEAVGHLRGHRAGCTFATVSSQPAVADAFRSFGSGSVVQLPVRLSGESRIAVGARRLRRRRLVAPGPRRPGEPERAGHRHRRRDEHRRLVRAVSASSITDRPQGSDGPQRLRRRPRARVRRPGAGGARSGHTRRAAGRDRRRRLARPERLRRPRCSRSAAARSSAPTPSSSTTSPITASRSARPLGSCGPFATPSCRRRRAERVPSRLLLLPAGRRRRRPATAASSRATSSSTATRRPC